MKSIFIYIIILAFVGITGSAQGEDIFIDANAEGDLTITWTHPDCTNGNPDWLDADGITPLKYRIKYKKASSLLWEYTFYSDGDAVNIPAPFLEIGVVYKFRVEYFGKRNGCKGFKIVRTIDTRTYLYEVAIFNEIQIIPNVSKKIHGQFYDKCLYPYTWPGGSIDSVRIYQWGCYNEDIKAFLIDELPGGRVRMKSQMLDLCIVPKAAFTGDIARIGLGVGVDECYIPNAIYLVQPVDSEVFWLVNEVNGRCLIPSDAADGAPLFQSPCSNNDSRQNFYFEDF